MNNGLRIPAIVLSSHTIGLGVIRALGIMGVPVIAVYYEKHDMGYVSKYVKEKLYVSHPEKNEDEFVNLLKSLIRRYKYNAKRRKFKKKISFIQGSLILY